MKSSRISKAFWGALLAGLSLIVSSRSTLGAAAPVSPVLPAHFQSQLVELYSKNRCDEIVRRTNNFNVFELRPNVMAIVAYCDPQWGNAEQIFAHAEALVPTGDLILVLHAKYRTRKNPKAAEELWKKVLLIARNPAFIEMANDYFAGKYDSVDQPINLSAQTLFGTFMIGAGQESNPRPAEFVFLNTHGSGAAYAKGDVTWRHWSSEGSLAVDYTFSENRYFSESGFDDLRQDLKIPIALHVFSDKDVVFQPIGGISFVGGQLYQSYYGMGVIGVVYKGMYRQSVQGIIYQDQVYNAELSPIAGAHYRFEYSWEFFPRLRYISMLLGIEHVSSNNASIFNNVTGYFPFSHTVVDANFKFEQNFRSVTVGIAPQFAYRVDSENSVYSDQSNGVTVTKRRNDWLLGVEPSVTVPLLPSVQLYAWYSYQQIISNMGPNDYVNRNQTDNVVGLALKATLSTYLEGQTGMKITSIIVILSLILSVITPCPLALAAEPAREVTPEVPNDVSGSVNEKINPGIVGWGNFLVPGLGATLMDEPGTGLEEAGLEIGSFYGGTLLAPEQRFRIDGTVDLPISGNINSAAIAQTLQQFGLKYHFYNTFYHYREAALDVADTARERDNPQPLYRGSAWDSFKAPFEWSNLSSLWVWPVIVAGATYLTVSYKYSTITPENYQLTPAGQVLYGSDIVGANPIGSYMGEDPLFRGFMQRELIAETGSIPLAIITQSLVFSILHDNHVNAFAVGIYLGISTLDNHGDFRKAMAVHFWLDMMDGLFTYLSTRRAAGENAPLMPPVGSSFRFEF